MKRLIATTAMALALTTGAHAQTGFDSFSSEQFEHGTHFYASNLIGMRIYASETAGKEDFRYTEGAEKEWDDIGEVDDVILNRNGEIEAVILGVGGFLGLGEKDIAVSMSELRVVGEHDDADDYFLVVDGNRDTLVDTPAYDHAERESASVDTPVHDGTRTSAVAEQMDRPGEHADARPVPAAPSELEQARKEADEEQRFVEASPASLSQEKLEGVRVYDASDEDIGEIHDVVMDDGRIDTVVLDVGGFLGLAEHRIGVSMKELRIVRSEDGSQWRAYIDATREELEQQPEYDQQS